MNILHTAAAAVLCFTVGYWIGDWRGDAKGAARIQQKWDKQTTDRFEAYAAEQKQVRESERALRDEADKRVREKENQIKNLDARNNALITELRVNRTQRPTNEGGMPKASGDSSAAKGCTGAELYGQDAEFLAREFKRAEEIRLSLKACLVDYAEAKALLDKH